MKTITNIIYPAFALFVFAWFALAPQAQATCQQGCDTVNANTLLGEDALLNDTTGTNNVAVGFDALLNNTGGTDNTAVGRDALYFNTTGLGNTANGFSALFSNTTGGFNTATGYSALGFNTTGYNNTADGVNALGNNTTGFENSAVGEYALLKNTIGHDNTAVGWGALQFNTSGNYNTSTGHDALVNNTTGNNNTANGNNALVNNTTGSFNIAIGNNAGYSLTTGINNIDIGNQGVVGDSKTIRIGRQGLQTATYIAAISGATVPTGVPVIVDTTGHLGTTTSSALFKEAIKPMDKASEAILALKPVTFHYKQDLDPDGIPQFGLVAEEVEKVNPDLVARDEEGKPYTVRYEAVNAMLLNEFLKEHRKVEELEKRVETLTAGLQKVSAQLATGRARAIAGLELSKSAPQAVCLPAVALLEGGNHQ